MWTLISNQLVDLLILSVILLNISLFLNANVICLWLNSHSILFKTSKGDISKLEHVFIGSKVSAKARINNIGGLLW